MPVPPDLIVQAGRVMICNQWQWGGWRLQMKKMGWSTWHSAKRRSLQSRIMFRRIAKDWGTYRE